MSADTEANPAVIMACSSERLNPFRYGRIVSDASGLRQTNTQQVRHYDWKYLLTSNRNTQQVRNTFWNICLRQRNTHQVQALHFEIFASVKQTHSKFAITCWNICLRQTEKHRSSQYAFKYLLPSNKHIASSPLRFEIFASFVSRCVHVFYTCVWLEFLFLKRMCTCEMKNLWIVKGENGR